MPRSRKFPGWVKLAEHSPTQVEQASTSPDSGNNPGGD